MSQISQPAAPAASPEWLRVVQQKVETLRFGVVQLVVHDGRVTQIERTEKTRITAPPSNSQDSTAL
ncbi:DUF2292 domain-containing protein [Oleiharenicola lentus]|uniref:DUF2292 domain-containing protein n=1 Tax=Oleiharenicola lentus TaxID=2508720 RepID=A0A4Q1C384_9BACT|nr:YezD family protein [Oleiharenicola lentus]RXK52797.1 DUF2292 domain-containing protein [Oleiharenicola lentus]